MVWGTSGVLAGLGKEIATVGKYRRMQSRGRAVEQVGALMAPGAEPVRLRTFGCADACRHYWAKLDAHQKKALVYHELCHCFMRNGKPSLQKHEFEGFVSELRHFGAWAADLEAVQEVLSPQLSLVEDGEDGEGAVAGATGETPKVATSSQKDGVDSAAMWGTP